VWPLDVTLTELVVTDISIGLGLKAKKLYDAAIYLTRNLVVGAPPFPWKGTFASKQPVNESLLTLVFASTAALSQGHPDSLLCRLLRTCIVRRARRRANIKAAQISSYYGPDNAKLDSMWLSKIDLQVQYRQSDSGVNSANNCSITA
jgi:hypothetical protein